MNLEAQMKKALLSGLAVLALGMVALTPAEASGGCGPYAYRNDYGACRLKPTGGYAVYGPGPGWGWNRHVWHRPWGWGGGYGPRW